MGFVWLSFNKEIWFFKLSKNVEQKIRHILWLRQSVEYYVKNSTVNMSMVESCFCPGVKGEAMVGRVDAKFLGISLETVSAQLTRTAAQEDPKVNYRGGSVISATDNVLTATGSIDIPAGIPSDHQNTLFIMGPTSNVHIPIQWRVNVKNFMENGENIVQLAEQLRNVKLEYKEQLDAVIRQHR